MKFPISVLHDLAKQLRGREYMSMYPAIAAYSDVLIAQHTLGTCVVSEETLQLLNDSAVENYMPLPYNMQQMCLDKRTIQLEGLPAVTVSEDFGWSDLFGPYTPAPNWMVIAEGEDGKLYALAHANQHFFEVGELIKEVPAPNARVRVGHVHVGNDMVSWELCNWAAAAVIFGKACPTNIDFIRCQHEHGEEPGDADAAEDQDNMILETVRDAETTFIADEIFEALGVKAPQPSGSVAALIQRLKEVEAETVKVDVDEEALEIHGKILKTLNFDAIAADFRALPKSKRTVTNLKKIIRQYVA